MPTVPKRSEERRRDRGPATDRSARVLDEKLGPEFPGYLTVGQLARDWYEALRTSGQARWYTDSDWATAALIAVSIDEYVAQPQASMLSSILTGIGNLAGTEGDRRRLRIELTDDDGVDEAEVAALDEFRDMKARLTAS